MIKSWETEAGVVCTDVDRFNEAKFPQAIQRSFHSVFGRGAGSLVRCGEPLSKLEIMVTWHGWGTESPPHVQHELQHFLR